MAAEPIVPASTPQDPRAVLRRRRILLAVLLFFHAIFVIGIVGLVLEFALIKLATAFTFEEVQS